MLVAFFIAADNIAISNTPATKQQAKRMQAHSACCSDDTSLVNMGERDYQQLMLPTLLPLVVMSETLVDPV